MGVAGPQGPAVREYYQHELAADRPAMWSHRDRLVLLLVIVVTFLGLALFFAFFIHRGP